MMGLSFGEKLEWVNFLTWETVLLFHLCLQSLSIVASVFGLQQLPLPFSGFSCALDHSEDHNCLSLVSESGAPVYVSCTKHQPQMACKSPLLLETAPGGSWLLPSQLLQPAHPPLSFVVSRIT